ncbi:hypothetical protein SBOR_0977 [Sclerotinia borealis F-4128]|uniref:Phytanoyl-CoA dioxygenase family protein n=1 Tax=Sclerotinia borealis (strain F-4128) TaxID=1432307 RepID=W9CP81_SCLBF|nr:hypothetical protein SBOR_0977 [Sclerotinia borealis F-4128]
MPPKQAQCKHVIISDEELKSGVTSLENVQAGVEEFHKNGIVVFENAIPHDIIDKFHEKMNADGAKKLEDPNLAFNHGNEKTNFSISPPLSKEWLVEDVWANKHAAAVMEAIIGIPQLVYAGSNINLPTQDSTSRQAVHVDSYADHHNFPTCIESFMYLHDVSPANGSTEIWPGSHHDWNFKDLASHGRGWIKASKFNRRAEYSPPFQPTIPKGSIAIRDLRLWHSGMPNLSDQNRIMVGFIYFPRWYRNPMRITLPSNCRFIVQKWKQVDAIGATEFVVGEIDHLDSKQSMLDALNFTQDPEKGIKQIREEIDLEQGRKPNAALSVTENDYWVPGREKLSERMAMPASAKEKGKQKGKAKSKGKPKMKGKSAHNDPLKLQGEGVKKNTRKPRKKITRETKPTE